ncbi:CAP domain-containing protein [Streptomyces roseicoloratus]|uniref:CAP domain-containing protein n=1 Tax=Streptomyces roseicoloratus TaxID=2508722 RepID=UPI001FE7C66F|nr:CAP domain-containing protein [Streptomyces roseicoloratus]
MQHDTHDAALAPEDGRGRTAGGRHRAGGPLLGSVRAPLRRPRSVRRPFRPRFPGRDAAADVRGGPSFRTTVAVAGALATALTVATGLYAMTQAGAAGAESRAVAGRDPAVLPAAPAAAVEAAPRAAGSAARYVSEVIALVNAERRKAGCGPLRSDARLKAAAQRHADDMAEHDYYAHSDRRGRDAGARISAAGYLWASWGENIHRGPHEPAHAVDEWMNSEGHRRNILNCSFEDVGVGVNMNGNGPWWVQDFARRR